MDGFGWVPDGLVASEDGSTALDYALAREEMVGVGLDPPGQAEDEQKGGGLKGGLAVRKTWSG